MSKNHLATLLSKYTTINKDELADKQQLSLHQQSVNNKLRTESQNEFESGNNLSEDDDLEEYYDILLSEQCDIFKEKTESSQNMSTLSWKDIISKQTFTPAKPRKQRKQKKQKQQFYNPYRSIKYLENSTLMLQQAKQSLIQESQLSTLTTKLGMKNVKSLGTVRCKKQMNNLIEYIETGQLPLQYTNKFQALIAQ